MTLPPDDFFKDAEGASPFMVEKTLYWAALDLTVFDANYLDKWFDSFGRDLGYIPPCLPSGASYVYNEYGVVLSEWSGVVYFKFPHLPQVADRSSFLSLGVVCMDWKTMHSIVCRWNSCDQYNLES